VASHVSLYDPDVWDRYQTLVTTFTTRGADLATAEQQAWAHLYKMVQEQALLLSFIDNFWWLAWMFVAVIPFVLFLGRGPRLADAPADVERHATIVEG
jgi:DHA2 family multidrug resistance protein